MTLPPAPAGFSFVDEGAALAPPVQQSPALPPAPAGFSFVDEQQPAPQAPQNALPPQPNQAQSPVPAPVQPEAPFNPRIGQGLPPARDIAVPEPTFDELPREAVTGFPITGSVAGVNLDTSVFAGKDDNERVQIMKTRFPNLETAIAQDTGETLVKLNDPNVEGGNEFRVFNAEGFGLRDIDAAVPAIGQGALALTGGVIGSGVGPAGGAAASGVASGLAEAGRQGVVNAALEQGGAEGNETDFGRIGLHAGLGAAGDLGGRALIAVGGKVINKFLTKKVAPGAAFDADGALTPQTIRALEDAGADPAQVSAELRTALIETQERVPDAANALAAADFKATGVTATRGQLGSDTVEQAIEQEAAKQPSGVVLRETLEGQSGQIQNAIREVGGSRDVSKLAAGRAAKDKADEVFGAHREKINTLYRQAEEVAQGRPNVNHANVLKVLRSPERGFAKTEAKAIEGFLIDAGHLTKGKKAVLQPMTAPQAEQLRQFIGKAGQTTDKRAKRFVLQVQDELDNAVVNSAFKDARAARAALGDLERSRLVSRIADGKTAPDDFVNSIISKGGKFDDIAVVKKTLGADSPAWLDMKQAVLDGLARKAGGATEGGVNLATFSRALSDDGIGVDKMRLLFEPAEIEALMSVKRVMQRVARATTKGKTNTSNTSAASVVARQLDRLASQFASPVMRDTFGMVVNGIKSAFRKRGAPKEVIKTFDDIGPRIIDPTKQAAEQAAKKAARGRLIDTAGERAVGAAGVPAASAQERLRQDGKQATR